jgi:outer membrane biosynthesis protein TonB
MGTFDADEPHQALEKKAVRRISGLRRLQVLRPWIMAESFSAVPHYVNGKKIESFASFNHLRKRILAADDSAYFGGAFPRPSPDGLPVRLGKLGVFAPPLPPPPEPFAPPPADPPFPPPAPPLPPPPAPPLLIALPL